MPLTTSLITGRVVLSNDTAFTDGVLTFTLSDVDTEVAQVVPAAGLSVTLDGDDIPTGTALWRNTTGVAGTSYAVRLDATITQAVGLADTLTLRKRFDLGSIQVGASSTYTIGELLRLPVGDATDWARQVRFFATRAAFVTDAAATTYTVGTVVECEGLSYRYTGSGTAIGDLPGWVPNGDIYARHFGAKEDYDQATQAGTDDYAAITAAMDYAASERSPGVAGGVVWITWRSLCSDTLIPPRTVWLQAVNPVSSYGQGGVAASAWPITYNEGSGIVFSHTDGPGILIKNDGICIRQLTLGGTSARKAAAITSGAQLRNAGILLETNDTSTAQVQSVLIEQCLIRDQPADGIYGCGLLYGVRTLRNAIVNCGGHGVAFDDGTLSGRVNQAFPGGLTIAHDRINNIGGHLVLINNSTDASDMPYRVEITNVEGFRCGNNPAILYDSAGFWLCGDQITVKNCAPGGVIGYTGVVAGLDYAVWVAGRNVHFENCRYISYVTNPVCIGQVTGVGTRDITFMGGVCSTPGTVPDYFAAVEAGTYLGLAFEGLSGDFNLTPVDADAVEALSAGGFGYYIHAGEKVSWGTVNNNPTSHTWEVAGTEVGKFTSAGFQATKSTVKNSQSYSASVADDAVYSIALTGTAMHGRATIVSNLLAGGFADVIFRCGTSPYCSLISSAGVTVGVGTTTLTGATGTDGQMNIAATSAGLIIENRTGVSRQYGISISAAYLANGSLT